MKEIVIAEKKDYLGIRKIWEERFTTDNIYLDIVFKELIPHCTTYIYKNNNEILSTISLFPLNYYNKSIQDKISYSLNQSYKNNKHDALLKGMYLFGVATLKKAEGEKLGIKLIEKAKKDLCSIDLDFIIEHPANQSLNNYYLKQGFSIFIPKIQYKIPSILENYKILPQLGTSLIIEDIFKTFSDKFIWSNSKILRALILLGEIESHINSYSKSYNLNKEETYIALNLIQKEKFINLLNNYNITKPNYQTLEFLNTIFQNSFFCFPLE